MNIPATLLYYALGIICIGCVVLFHEAAHLFAAGICGIEVEVFSFGFGPRLVGWQKGNTEFRISLLPFGGYCRMKGSDDLLRALDDKSDTFTHVENGSLFSVHPLPRAMTYLAGPLANIFLAIILCILLQATPYQVLSLPATVATVNDYPTLFTGTSASPAYDQGLRTGDILLSIGSIPITDWEQASTVLQTLQNGQAAVKISRNGKEATYTIQGEDTGNGTYRFGLTNLIPAHVSLVKPWTPERKAGLKAGDWIIGCNGQAVTNNLDLLAALATVTPSSGDIQLTIRHAGTDKKQVIAYTPIFVNSKLQNGFSLAAPTRWIEGKKLGKAIGKGTVMAFGLFTETIHSLYSILTGKQDDVRQVLTGPMRASYMIGNITALGWEHSAYSAFKALLYLLGVVSVSLAIANLIPLPSFDGGQILIALGEAITKHRINPKNYWRIQLIGLACIILIFILMYYVDIRYFWNSRHTTHLLP
ncbi:MAG: RIP metalloprotease RseP [Spirochaetia bacterium]|jgi:regulator of sigma E protease|nr:RIP metalloprotease RseP [Spirochaetia bacterium]